MNKEKLIGSILRILSGATKERPVAWSTILKTLGFTEGARKSSSDEALTDSRVVAVMNSLLMPCGKLRGTQNSFWY